jgi:hypothetical protein
MHLVPFIRIILLSTYLLCTAVTYGQTACDVAKLSSKDKSLLTKFWKDFGMAIKENNKAKLSTLIHFPFLCDNRFVEGAKNYEDVKVSKQLFDRLQFRVFFEEPLKKVVSNQSILKVIRTDYGEESNECSYSFGYNPVYATKVHPGQTVFFTIKKFGKQFLITSAWAME